MSALGLLFLDPILVCPSCIKEHKGYNVQWNRTGYNAICLRCQWQLHTKVITGTLNWSPVPVFIAQNCN